MKKILSIISVLAVLGVFTLSNTNIKQEQDKQVAAEKHQVQLFKVDPGGGGW